MNATRTTGTTVSDGCRTADPHAHAACTGTACGCACHPENGGLPRPALRLEQANLDTYARLHGYSTAQLFPDRVRALRAAAHLVKED